MAEFMMIEVPKLECLLNAIAAHDTTAIEQASAEFTDMLSEHKASREVPEPVHAVIPEVKEEPKGGSVGKNKYRK